MKKPVLAFLLLSLVGASGLLYAVTSQAMKGQSNVEHALTIVGNLKNGHYREVYAEFNEAMAEKLTIEKLEEMWKTLDTQLGGIRGFGTPREVSTQTHSAVIIPLHTLLTPAEAKIVFQADGKIAGLFVQPPEADSPQVEK